MRCALSIIIAHLKIFVYFDHVASTKLATTVPPPSAALSQQPSCYPVMGNVLHNGIYFWHHLQISIVQHHRSTSDHKWEATPVYNDR